MTAIKSRRSFHTLTHNPPGIVRAGYFIWRAPIRIEYITGAIRLAEAPKLDDWLSRDETALALSITTGRPITAANLAQHTRNSQDIEVKCMGGKPFYLWRSALNWHLNRAETLKRRNGVLAAA